MNTVIRLGVVVGLCFGTARLTAQDVTVTSPSWTLPDPAPSELPAAKLRPSYPDEMRSATQLGYVVVIRYVDATGQSLSLSAQGTHLPFQRAVEEEFQYWKYPAAKRDGKSVETGIWVAIIFNPKTASAKGPDATPRLLAASPAFMRKPPIRGKPPVVPVKFALDETGTIVSSRPEIQLNAQATQELEAALHAWRFAPARENGKPVAAEVVVPVICMGPLTAPNRGPSVPPKVLSQTGPEYPFAMRRFGLNGEVQVDFEVDAEGNVQNPVIFSSNNPEFDASALTAVRKWKFRPGTRNGQPATMKMRVPVLFRLEGGGRNAFSVEEGRDRSKLPAELQYDTPATIRNVQIPVYPYALLRDGITGDAEVVMYIDTAGRVGAVKVLSADRPEFGLALAAAAEGFTFDPALKNGLPVPYVLRLKQTFSRFELHDESGDELLGWEKKHPDRIVGASQLDAPLRPISRRAPVPPITAGTDGGSAVIECIVDQEGHARLPRIVTASAPAFGYAAAEAVNGWWFERPTHGGKAVAARVQIPFSFKPTKQSAAARPATAPAETPAAK